MTHFEERRKTNIAEGALVLHVYKVQGVEGVTVEDVIKPRKRRYLMNFTEQDAVELYNILGEGIKKHTNITIVVEGDLA